MVNGFNVGLFESMRYYLVRFNYFTTIAKHHGQSIQRRLVRIDAILFGSIQLIHYNRKASWSMDSTSACSNRCDTIWFDSINSLQSQSELIESNQIVSHRFEQVDVESIDHDALRL